MEITKPCTGTVEIYKRENPCQMPLGHSGGHTVQVEHRKHSHNGAWCLQNWVDCPGGCQGHMQDESHTPGCEIYKQRSHLGEPFPINPLKNVYDYPKGKVVTFEMYRGTDESGISGEGKVLDGVIFEDGLTVVRWVTVQASQSTVVYDCSAKEGQKPTTGFQKFMDIHVRAHPANNTVIKFYEPQRTCWSWIQPQGQFDIDQKRAEEAARYIMWAVQQPWFRWPRQVQEEKGNVV